MKTMMQNVIVFLTVLCLIVATSTLEAQIVTAHTRKLDSAHGLPFNYYYAPFCKPRVRKIIPIESIGQALLGDQIEPSIFKFDMDKLKTVHCDIIHTNDDIQCPKITPTDIENLKDLIQKNYEVQMLVDNMPAGSKRYQRFQCGELPIFPIPDKTSYSRPNGFPLGCYDDVDDKHYLNNHWTFIVSYHQTKSNKRYIVGVEVIPSSVDHDLETFICHKNVAINTGVHGYSLELESLTPGKSIQFSYSIHWKQSEVVWASRWDAYINSERTSDPYTHLLSIINLFVIVIVLSSMIGSLLYYRIGKDMKSEEVTSWKTLKYDVFSPPAAPSLLAAFFGGGVQLLGMLLTTLALGMFVFTSPGNRGKYGTLMLLLYGMMGIISGYFSMRVYKLMGGVNWKLTTLLQALIFPAIMFFLYVSVNLIVRLTTSSSTSLNLFALSKIFCMWFFISMPLAFIGAYFGYRKKKIHIPFDDESAATLFDVSRASIEPWYSRYYIINILGGAATFLSMLTDIFPVMTGIWMRKYYHVFSFLLFAVIISIIASAEFAMSITYYQLLHKNPNWWWRAFITCGSSAIFFMGYCVYFYIHIIKIKSAAFALVFFQYMSMATFVFFLLTGSIGLLGSLWFVRSLYFSLERAMSSHKI